MSVHVAWMEQASCRGIDPEVWFPSSPGVPGQREAQRAVQICRECPVVFECREYGRTFSRGHGVWGGVYRSRPGRPLKRDR